LAANEVLATRVTWLTGVGARYHQFLVPEKSVIYGQYLPGILKYAPFFDYRPATLLHEDSSNVVTYLFEPLSDHSKIQMTYHRGDSHPNQIGGYVIYRSIYLEIEKYCRLTPMTPFHALSLGIEQRGGDLFGQLSPEVLKNLPELFRTLRPATGCEYHVTVKIDPAKRTAHRTNVRREYTDWFTTRETVVWENSNKSLPRCVIFRDSTAVDVLDLLAEHFSYTVAVWFSGTIIEEVVEMEKPDIVIQIQAERFAHLLYRTRPITRMATLLTNRVAASKDGPPSTTSSS
jgi:hypothetical protein